MCRRHPIAVSIRRKSCRKWQHTFCNHYLHILRPGHVNGMHQPWDRLHRPYRLPRQPPRRRGGARREGRSNRRSPSNLWWRNCRLRPSNT